MADSSRKTKKYHDEDEVTPRHPPPPDDPGLAIGGVAQGPFSVPAIDTRGDDQPVNNPDPLTGLPPEEEPR